MLVGIVTFMRENSIKTTRKGNVYGMFVAPEMQDYISGYADGTIRPNQNLTRAEAVTIINRVEKRGPLQGVTIPAWDDVPNAYWALH